MLSFHDLGQKWWPKVEALLGNNGGWEKRRRRLRERERDVWNFVGLSEERESCFLVLKERVFSSFLLFYSSSATCPYLSGAKRVHFPFLLWPTLSHKSEKNLTFETLKSCLGLHVVSLIPVSRVSLHPSRPVFKSNQYIYQNAQNKTPSVVQRLVSLNFKLHAKRWFLN